MATNKEKQLATLLLKERLERLTGKKVILKEKKAIDLKQQIMNLLTSNTTGIIWTIRDIVEWFSDSTLVSPVYNSKTIKDALFTAIKEGLLELGYDKKRIHVVYDTNDKSKTSNKKVSNFKLNGFDLAQAFTSNDWENIKTSLEENDVKNIDKFISTIKQSIFVQTINLAIELGSSEEEDVVDDYIEKASSTSLLATICPKIYKNVKGKWKYFGFLPVDYNRGGEMDINIMFSNDKKWFDIVEGEY